jgi:hypothetical protein
VSLGKVFDAAPAKKAPAATLLKSQTTFLKRIGTNFQGWSRDVLRLRLNQNNAPSAPQHRKQFKVTVVRIVSSHF